MWLFANGRHRRGRWKNNDEPIIKDNPQKENNPKKKKKNGDNTQKNYDPKK